MSDSTNGWELRVSRHIAAAPELVWRVMTERTGEWFCPKPWRYEVVARDARPGGHETSVMHGPDGEEIRNDGVYLASPGSLAAVSS